MKSAKIKQAEEMELKDLKWFSIAVSIGCIVGSLLFNGVLMIDKKTYYNIAPILLGLSIMLGIVMIVLSFNKTILCMSYYRIAPIQGIMAFLSFYLVAVNYLTPGSTITKVLLFLNYVFVDILFLCKRVFVKNEDYIKNLRKGTHGKYIKNDIALALIITITIITIAKIIDSRAIIIEGGKVDTFIAGVIGIGVSISFSVLSITGIANYVHNIRCKKRKNNEFTKFD